MTGLEAYNYFLQSFKRIDKSSEFYTALADTIMDMRSRMLSDEHSVVAQVSTLVVGGYKIAFPSDFGHLIGDITVRDTASDDVYLPLNRISKTEWDAKYNQALSSAVGNRLTGAPLDYCVYGREFYIGPPSDKTTYEFTINYTTEDTPAYTSVTATIPFTDQFREVVRAGALFRMFREIGNYPESDIWGNVYRDGVNNIIENDEFNREGSITSIRYNGV